MCYIIDMRPIPKKLKTNLSQDKFYEKCCVCYVAGVQWHHNLIWQGRQENEPFCILPLCPKCHEQARNKEFKERLDWIMWNRATPEQIIYYSKANNYLHEKQRLNDKFGGAWINPIKEK